ncbi:hypothetical protein V1521DRAFT_450415, partial [Lipomyces starkeyi]
MQLYHGKKTSATATDLLEFDSVGGRSGFEKTELHTITRQQVYNVWLSYTKTQWERDTDDFRSAQILIAEQDGYHLIEGLQEPGVSL